MSLKQGLSRPTMAELAYAAGILDGEGSISASPSSHCPKSIRIFVSVAMCDSRPIEFLARVFGGAAKELKRRTNAGKPIFRWALYCSKAADFLELVLPYLTVHQERAQTAIRLARMAKPRGVAKGHHFTDEEIAERLHLAGLIRAANFASNGRIAKYAP